MWCLEQCMSFADGALAAISVPKNTYCCSEFNREQHRLSLYVQVHSVEGTNSRDDSTSALMGVMVRSRERGRPRSAPLPRHVSSAYRPNAIYQMREDVIPLPLTFDRDELRGSLIAQEIAKDRTPTGKVLRNSNWLFNKSCSQEYCFWPSTTYCRHSSSPHMCSNMLMLVRKVLRLSTLTCKNFGLCSNSDEEIRIIEKHWSNCQAC